jgi:hypothetical protein
MTIEQLTIKESELYTEVMDLYKKDSIIPQSKETEMKMEIVYDMYKDIHKQYAEIADKQDEALKRGLFIQWYAWTEPSWSTGIGLLDDVAMTKIITILNDKIVSNTLDAELKWMLNYYVNPAWVFAFDKFKGYQGLDNVIKNCTVGSLPKSIDKISMQTRGQMGLYWTSGSWFD